MSLVNAVELAGEVGALVIGIVGKDDGDHRPARRPLHRRPRRAARAADAAHRGLPGRGLAPAGLPPGARDARGHLGDDRCAAPRPPRRPHERRPGRLPRPRRGAQRAGPEPRDRGTTSRPTAPRTSPCAPARPRRCACCARWASRWRSSPTSRARPRAPPTSPTLARRARRGRGAPGRGGRRGGRGALLLPPPRRHRPRAREGLRLPQARPGPHPAGRRGPRARRGRARPLLADRRLGRGRRGRARGRPAHGARRGPALGPPALGRRGRRPRGRRPRGRPDRRGAAAPIPLGEEAR